MDEDLDVKRSHKAAADAMPLVGEDLAAAGISAGVELHPRWSDTGEPGVMVDLGDDAPTFALWLRTGVDDEFCEDDPARDEWVVDREDVPHGTNRVHELHAVSDLAEARRLLIEAARSTVQVTHPAPSRVYDALSEDMWEALACAATEGVVTMKPNPTVAVKLRELGLLSPNGRPTALGYAVLLSWHRRHRRPRFPLSLVVPADNRHVQRMRTLWAC